MGIRGKTLLVPLALALASLAMAGCSSKQPAPIEDDPIVNEVDEPMPAPEPEPQAEPTRPEPKAAEPVANFAEDLPEDKPITPDQQMIDDADATGLTARLPASDGGDTPEKGDTGEQAPQ